MKRWLLILLGLVVSATAAGQGEIEVREAPAWDADFNPQVNEYDVVTGDTLWDISARVVGDPYKWPKVWSLNPEITNPHWIYPGDRIRFFQPELELPSQADLIAGNMGMPEDYGDPGAADIDEISSDGGASRDGNSSGPEIEMVNAPPRRNRGAGVLYRYLERFVSPKEVQEAGVLSNAVPDTIMLRAGDGVFLRFPSSKRPEPGSFVLSYRTTVEVYHPRSGDHRGFLTQITGILKVESPKSEEITKARIIRNFVEIERGNLITPMEQDLLVRLIEIPTGKDVKGVVMAVRNGREAVVGDMELVYIDKGKRHGLERGNRLQVVANSDDLTGDSNDSMTQSIGLLQIVDARDSASTCLIIKAAREIEPGLRVRTVVNAAAAAAEAAATEESG